MIFANLAYVNDKKCSLIQKLRKPEAWVFFFLYLPTFVLTTNIIAGKFHILVEQVEFWAAIQYFSKNVLLLIITEIMS